MAENEPGQDPGLSEDARLTSLDRRLKQAQADEAARSEGRHAVADYAKSPGYRVLSVLVGYPLGCALIGYAIDRFASSACAFRSRSSSEASRASWGDIGSCPSSSSVMPSFPVRPHVEKCGARAWDMPANEPAKARFL